LSKVISDLRETLPISAFASIARAPPQGGFLLLDVDQAGRRGDVEVAGEGDRLVAAVHAQAADHGRRGAADPNV